MGGDDGLYKKYSGERMMRMLWDNRRRNIGEILQAALCLLFVCSMVGAQAQTQERVSINADKVTYLIDEDKVLGQGNVVARYKGGVVRADEMVWFVGQGLIVAQGNVVVEREGKVVKAKSLKYFIDEDRIECFDATSKEGVWFYKGKEIVWKKGVQREYSVKQGWMTTCDRPYPHYRVEASRIDIAPGERIWAYNCVMYIGHAPVFYLPYYTRSLKGGPSGFAFSPGHEDSKGYFLLGRYNWYERENLRGSIFFDYFELREDGEGFDLRYPVPGENGEGYIYGYYIDERETVYDKDIDDYTNPPGAGHDKRWKIHLRHRQNLSESVLAIIRMDKFSDAGFNDDYRNQERWRGFSRDDLEDQEPEGSVSITKYWGFGSLQVYGKGRVNHFQDEVEKAPKIYFDLKEGKLFDTPFYIDFDAWSTHFEEEPHGAHPDEQGGILRISCPRRVGGVSIEPAVKLEGYHYKGSQEGDEFSIFNPEYSVGITSTLYRGYRNGALLHTFQPRFTLTYRQDPSSRWEELFSYQTAPDDARREIALEVINRVYKKEGDGNRKILDWRLTSAYEGMGERVWKDIFSDLVWLPRSDLSIHAETSYDSEIDHFEIFDTDINLTKDRWNAGLGSRFYEPEGEKNVYDIYGNFGTWIGDKWRVNLYSRYDMNEDRFNKHEVVLWRDLHCWELYIVWEWEREEEAIDTAVYVTFLLKGVPWVRIGGLPFYVGD